LLPEEIALNADERAQLRKLHCDLIDACARLSELRPHLAAAHSLRLGQAQTLVRAARQLVDQTVAASATTIDAVSTRRQA